MRSTVKFFFIFCLMPFILSACKPDNNAVDSNPIQASRQSTSKTDENISSDSIPNKIRVNPKDDAEMVFISSGKYLMGSDYKNNSLSFDEKPTHKVFLDAYWIYKYPVTVTQYRKFCDETGHPMPPMPPWGWKDDHPIVNVSWFDAVDYCNWAGMRLPTEAEWEKAARGTDGRIYPWGNDWDTSRLKCSKNIMDEDGTTPVGMYPSGASPYGVLDMSGNICEWTADWYDENYYKYAPKRNPTGPKSGINRVLRGGGWRVASEIYSRSDIRDRGEPDTVSEIDGFRCVK